MITADRFAWMDSAACLEVGPFPFFEEEDRDTDDPVGAKALCRSCVSRADCLAWALEHGIRDGVFGGFTDKPRRQVARRHRAGASLEDIIAEDDARVYARLEKSQATAEAAAERHRVRERARYHAGRAALNQETAA